MHDWAKKEFLKALSTKTKLDPHDFLPGEDPTEWFQRIMRGKNNRNIKTAAEGADLSGAMEMIKDELDIFNYGVHLDKMMKIRGELLADGRNSEADTILEIIKKELDDIDGIHKKLVEVYTSLGQVPRQRKQVSKPVEPRMEPRVEMPRMEAPKGPEVPNLPR
jgi:hypothetical protein